jgi:hypothetical protein
VFEALVEVEEVLLKPVNIFHRAYEAGLCPLGNPRDGRVLIRRV